MCPAIPGQIPEATDVEHRLARVDVAGVRRAVNIGLLDEVEPGDWVFSHELVVLSGDVGSHLQVVATANRESRLLRRPAG